MPRRNAPKKVASKNAPKTVTRPVAISRDEVAQEAFKMFQARHGVPGDPVADWFEAERIVRSRIEAKAPKALKSAEAAAAAGNGRNGARRSSRRRK